MYPKIVAPHVIWTHLLFHATLVVFIQLCKKVVLDTTYEQLGPCHNSHEYCAAL